MKKYQIIYADPPWSYQGEMMNSSVTDHYGVMGLNGICNLPIKDLADDNCILFMWVTLPKLNEFMRVVEAWGFQYKTVAFVWVKENKKSNTPFMGLGRWTRANPEIMILATKGKISRQRADIRQLQQHKIGRHSQKPSIFRKLIVDLVGELPRIELFARKPETLIQDPSWKGWDVWGNEVDSDISL